MSVDARPVSDPAATGGPGGCARRWPPRAPSRVPGDPADGAPPLRGTTTADVVVLGGGYTGLWTALRVAELAPEARIVLLEADICGGGPSGRNGGFVDGLVGRAPDARSSGTARPRARWPRPGRWTGRWTRWGAGARDNGVDAWYTKAGSLSVSAAPAQDDKWCEAVAACARLGVGRPVRGPDRRRGPGPGHSPVMRAGAFMPGRRDRPAGACSRAGLRRVALERGVVIHEGTRVVELDGERPGWPGGSARGAGGRRHGRTGRPVRVRTASAAGARARSSPGPRSWRMNAWAAAWPSFGRRLVTWSSYIVLTEPIPERLDEIGWTGGEGLADARFTLHYLRTTRGRAHRDRRRRRPGRVRRADRGHVHRRRASRPPRAAAGLRRLFPSLRGRAHRGRVGRPDRHLRRPPAGRSGPCPGRPIHFAHGYSGNGVGPSVVAGRLLAGLALADGAPAGRRPAGAVGRCVGGRTRAFPPEPLRYVGARVVREAIVRREAAEERGEPVSPVLREVTRLPRRLGYHLSPD